MAFLAAVIVIYLYFVIMNFAISCNTLQLQSKELFFFSGESIKWMVPISVCTSKSPEVPVKTFLLEDTKMTIELDDVEPDTWVKVSYMTGVDT